MEKNNRTNPSQAESPQGRPQQHQQNNDHPQEGDIRKVGSQGEEAVPDDPYEVEKDDFAGENKEK